MEKTVKRQRFAIVILAIALVFGFMYLNETKTEFQNRFNTLSQQYNNLNNEINSIYNNVDEQLKKQASLITYFDFNYGELDRENMKVPVSVKIIPKAADSSTKLFLDFGERTVEMKKGENLEYTAVFKSDLFVGTENERVKLLIQNGDTTETEELDWYVSSLHGHFLPSITATLIFDNTEFSEEKRLTVEGDVIFHFDVLEKENLPFKNLKAIYIHNDTVVEQQEIPVTIFDDSVDTYPLDRNFPDVKEGDSFKICVEGEDEYGFIHRATIKDMVVTEENDTVEEVVAEGEIILDKEGNVLYGGKK